MGYGTGLNRGKSGRIWHGLADIGAVNGDRFTNELAHAAGGSGTHAMSWRDRSPFLRVLYCGFNATGVLQTGKGGGIWEGVYTGFFGGPVTC